ncbi:serine/threonine-protein kinase RIO3-like isoform X2 [Phymastichus coffea]|nr:serine/threonine-protein kinase RIO3-like isoform X2 [Phymastichus coffea]XP_058808435.1 serine/threonine-protein kinase RIO3-like isoform X2 [Phymastichus coffea]
MSAWAKIQANEEPISFDQIRSEQLAQSLQEKEVKKHLDSVVKKHPEIPEQTVSDLQESPKLFEIDQTESDEMIAQLLQTEMNQEHDLMLKRTEKKFNRNSKVNISYLNYRAGIGEPEEPKKDDDEERDFDRFVSIEKEFASIPRCGYKKIREGEGSQILTKHDVLMNSRINACRVLEFPPGIQTGDTGGFDVKLNNKVFNSLRQHSYAHCSRERAKAHSKPQPKSQAPSKDTE